MRLTQVLHREHIVVPLEATTIRAAVQALVQNLVDTGAVTHPEKLDQLLADERVRDVIHVGDRVLLPHLRTEAVDELVVSMGIAPSPLRAGARGEVGVEQVVVLVLAPPPSANVYLQMVAALARALRKEEVVDRLVDTTSPEEVLAIREISSLVVQPRLTVRDVMTQRVYRVYPQTPVRELLELMSRHELKAVPVVGEKREVLGVVTDRDLLRHLLPNIVRVGAGEGEPDSADGPAAEVQVREIMSRSVMCISEDQGLAEVASIMVNKDVERLPVVAEGRLTGFLTRGDILRKLFGK
ncbi:MAG TPA: CBS domain-containing protein [Longimicrobiaceae bacterium]|nr:CBS domain-containing protein [Longimicrobiaceae bacterium]